MKTEFSVTYCRRDVQFVAYDWQIRVHADIRMAVDPCLVCRIVIFGGVKRRRDGPINVFIVRPLHCVHYNRYGRHIEKKYTITYRYGS